MTKASKKPQYATRLAKLIDELGLNQSELSRLAAVDQSAISHYLAGRREPGKFPALIFAGLSRSLDDRAFWLEFASLEKEQGDLIAEALGVVSPVSAGGSYERELVIAFLRFWNSPQNDVRERTKDLLQSMIFSDLPERKRS